MGNLELGLINKIMKFLEYLSSWLLNSLLPTNITNDAQITNKTIGIIEIGKVGDLIVDIPVIKYLKSKKNKVIIFNPNKRDISLVENFIDEQRFKITKCKDIDVFIDFVRPNFYRILLLYTLCKGKRLEIGGSFLLRSLLKNRKKEHIAITRMRVIPMLRYSSRKQLYGLIKNLFRKQISLKKKKNIIVCPTGESIYKLRDPRKWRELLKILIRKFPDYRIIVTSPSKPTEKNFVNIVTRGLKVLNLGGKTTLKQLEKLISESSLVITVDSGPSHIAALYEIPEIVIFYPEAKGNIYAWRPLNEKAIILKSVGEAINYIKYKNILGGDVS